MTAPNVCAPWSTVEAVESCGPDLGDVSVDLIERMLLVSSNLLYRDSGQLFPGICTDYVRPCAARASSNNSPSWHGQPLASMFLGSGAGGYGSPAPWLWLPGWGTCNCTTPNRDNCCRGVSELALPGYPIVEILEVRENGLVLDPAEYRVDDDGAWLVRLPNVDDTGDPPARRHWPCCQRMDLPDTEDHTFSVSYTYGQDPPEDGKLAAEMLTRELLTFCSTNECNLNADHLRSLARENLTFELADPQSLGIEIVPAVKMFLDSINPKVGGKRITRAARAWSPDVKRHFRRPQGSSGS